MNATHSSLRTLRVLFNPESMSLTVIASDMIKLQELLCIRSEAIQPCLNHILGELMILVVFIVS
jgi:hypothetical protein